MMTLLWRLCFLLAARSASAAEVAGVGAAAAVPPCPAEASGARSGLAGEEFQVVFLNAAGVNVKLQWVDVQGEEQFIAEIEDGDRTEMNSYAGHIWRARDQATGKLVFEQALGDWTGQRRDLVITPCGDFKLGPKAVPQDDTEWRQQHGRFETLVEAGCPLPALLSEGPVRGLHVICATLGRLCIFEQGLQAEVCSHSLELQGGETVSHIVAMVRARMLPPDWKPRPQAPEPALFTASGRRLPGTLRLEEAGVPQYRHALVFQQGGQWHWPPIRVGFERPLQSFVHSGSGQIVLRTLSLIPRVFEVKSFIEEAECDRVLEVAGPQVAKSAVVVKDADHGKPVDDWRTSENTFLTSAGDKLLEALDERVQNLTRIPITHSELAQVLKYSKQGRYDAHTDYFEPRDYQRDKATMQLIANGAHNRLLTVFMYMSNVEEGGETFFPLHGGKKTGRPINYGDCTQGYSVTPERRKVIIFYNMHPDGQSDPNSLHGGCRVQKGTKWSANFWMWNVPRSYKPQSQYRRMAKRLSEWDVEADRLEEAGASELAAAGAKAAEL